MPSYRKINSTYTLDVDWIIFMKTPLVLKMISHELFYFEKIVDLKNFGFEQNSVSWIWVGNILELS